MSESFLSQEEVDALLEGVTGESQKLVHTDFHFVTVQWVRRDAIEYS